MCARSMTQVNRDYEILFQWFLERIKCDSNGYYRFEITDFTHAGYEDDVFRVSPCCVNGTCDDVEVYY